jgi:hypothetical protein
LGAPHAGAGGALVKDDWSPFERLHGKQEPGIVGASWWRASLASREPLVYVPDPVSRRQAIGWALGATGAVVGVGALLALVAHSCSSEEDFQVERRTLLDMQKTYGWSFGAATESVTFDGSSNQPFDRAALPRMAVDLRPPSPRALPYYVPTLFEVLGASPTAAAEEAEAIVPLEQVLLPIFTAEMRRAYMQGRALADELERGDARDVAVIVDLEGPSAVAFAAGASEVLEPVFVFGNWPHPRGVVQAHRTLAAAAYFQPLFARSSRPERAPLLVLDRQRLASYSDDASQFDNRYAPALPQASVLRSWGVKNVLYVTPSSAETSEPWDVSEAFVAYKQGGLNVKLVAAQAFFPDYTASAGAAESAADASALQEKANGAGRYYYGGSASNAGWFWRDYPWSRRGAAVTATEPGMSRPGVAYDPPSVPVAPLVAAATLGTVAVAVSRSNGRILGALANRNGSWNRAEGGTGG